MKWVAIPVAFMLIEFAAMIETSREMSLFAWQRHVRVLLIIIALNLFGYFVYGQPR